MVPRRKIHFHNFLNIKLCDKTCVITVKNRFQRLFIYVIDVVRICQRCFVTNTFLSTEKKKHRCVTLSNHALFHNQVHWRKYVVIFYPYRSRNKNIGGSLTTAHHKNKLETSLKMLGHQRALIRLIASFSLCFPIVCISKTLNSGRQQRYTEVI